MFDRFARAISSRGDAVVRHTLIRQGDRVKSIMSGELLLYKTPRGATRRFTSLAHSRVNDHAVSSSAIKSGSIFMSLNTRAPASFSASELIEGT